MPKQAIYHFRGADSKGLQRIKEMFNCTEYHLTVNFRSSPQIVNVANSLIKEKGYIDMKSSKNDKGKVFFAEFQTDSDCYTSIVGTISKFVNK